jgi:hypothetical protein
MIEMLQYIKETIYKKVNIHEIKVNIPEIQRELKNEAVEDIIEFQDTYFKLHSEYFTCDYIKIVSCENTGIDYLIDGQHRIAAFNKLHKKYPERKITLNSSYIIIKKSYTKNDNEIVEYLYKIVNTCTPNNIATLSIDNYKILKDFKEYFNKNFKDYIKATSKPQKPHINIDKLCDYIIEKRIIEELKIHTSEQFINIIIEINSYYSTLEPDKFKKFGLKDIHTLIAKKNKYNNDLYLGFYNKYEWVDRIVESKKYNKSYEDLLHITYDYRPKIPKSIRKKVWEGKNGTCIYGPCYCCNEQIALDTFECGHIIPVSLGGQTNEENLLPICHNCNMDMGCINLEEYKVKLC